jgi:hypothetical protein
MGTISQFLVGDTPVMVCAEVRRDTGYGGADLSDDVRRHEDTLDRLASVFDGSPQNHAAKAARRSFDHGISH